MSNCTLKAASRLIAVIDMVGASLIGIYVAVLWGIEFTNEVEDLVHGGRGKAKDKLFHPVTYSEMYGDSRATESVTTSINVLLLCMIKMYVGFTLKQGIERNHLLKCKIWLISTTAVLGVGILFIVYQIAHSSGTIITSSATIDVDLDSSESVPTSYFVAIVIGIIYETFCMFIISMYMRQMFEPNVLANQIRLELNGKPINHLNVNEI